jgi:hypothetical protein
VADIYYTNVYLHDKDHLLFELSGFVVLGADLPVEM